MAVVMHIDVMYLSPVLNGHLNRSSKLIIPKTTHDSRIHK